MARTEEPPEDEYFRRLWTEALWGAALIATIIVLAEIMAAIFR
ncbi:MAG: hypothetical protein ACM3OO_07775 [Planctomycetaceae bacterium]|jgi:hypothetical protein